MGFKTPKEAWAVWDRRDVRKHKAAMYTLADGTYAVYVPHAVRPAGAVRTKPQPPYPADPRQGTKDAMGELEDKHKDLVTWACRAAVEIARRKLTVHSREVRDALVKEGLIPEDGPPEFWLGAAMHRLAKEKIIEKTGHNYKYTDAARGIHERTITVWQLVDGADVSRYV